MKQDFNVCGLPQEVYLRSIKMKNSLFVVFVLSIFIVSCDPKNDLNESNLSVEFDFNKLSSEKILWDLSKPNNYQYNLTKMAYGAEYLPINTLIIVEDGQFKRQEPNTQYGSASEQYLTIDKIYETIENIFKEYDNTEQSKNDYFLIKIIVEYDEKNHIPIKIEFFYYIPENLMDASSYWKYEIKDYKIN
jgi:hypothetical protein